jgi:arylsulfatase A-like enzyme
MSDAKLVESRDKLLPAMLKRRGYRTAILGKWHLAGYPKDFTKTPMHPLECGFDYHFGTPGSNDVPKPQGRVQNRELFDICDNFTFQVPLIRGRDVIELPADQELFTKRYTEEAVKWIRNNKNRRFFLYLAHNMPHAPVFASKSFRGKSQGGRFGDVVEEIDWSVGKVTEALRETGIERSTLVIFTSDNGPWSMFEVHAGTAKPLRGEKGTAWEGGYRVPGIFSWPGRIQPGEVEGIGANLDLYATFAEMTGGTQPTDEKGYISKDLSGVLFRGEESPRTEWLFSAGALAFRSGKYKIHLSTKKRSSNPDTRKTEPMETHDPPLLFDLENDIGEQQNISGKHPEVVKSLLRKMKAFQGTN